MDNFDSNTGEQIITARGTADGLIIRLDGRAQGSHLRAALIEFMNARKGFISGNAVTFEWGNLEPHTSIVEELSNCLFEEFAVRVKDSRLRSEIEISEFASTKQTDPEFYDDSESTRVGVGLSKNLKVSEINQHSLYGKRSYERVTQEDPLLQTDDAGANTTRRTRSLFDGVEALGLGGADTKRGADNSGFNSAASTQRAVTPSTNTLRAVSKIEPQHDGSWDDADARVVYATLRSGQKIETDHSLVIIGDVNSGAELVAGGDIIVLGFLRGVAHAGAYDETGGGRSIFALSLQPTQLRIGSVISRGGGDLSAGQMSFGPEVARVEDGLIVVKPYQSRTQQQGRR